MNLYRDKISLKTTSRLQIIDITSRISQIIKKSGFKNGFSILHVPHTTATIAVNEGDPDLWEDILEVLTRLVPTDAKYRHNLKYGGTPSEQNAHAHILNCLLNPSITIPFIDGRLVLGTWQSILFIELDGPRVRKVDIMVYGV